MKLAGKHVVVTGGANGIGRALCLRFHEEGARAITVADLEFDRAQEVAHLVNGWAKAVDVARESEVQALVREAEERNGPIDLFCANAGIFTPGGDATTDEEWERIWGINVKAHIYASRAVVPGMIARGGGYFLSTASAAGLLSQIGSAPYAVTKHAAVAFAEWLSITYGDRGLKVSCLCPQGVRTRMLEEAGAIAAVMLRDSTIEPEDVTEAAWQAMQDHRFLILPHPEVADYYGARAGHTDKWLASMRKIQRKIDDYV